MEITKVATDNRGDVFLFENGKRTHMIVSINKGLSRGGHSHTGDQWHICLGGQMTVRVLSPDTGLERVFSMVEGDAECIPAGHPHLFTAEEDSVVAESRMGPENTVDYEPYR